MKDPAAFFSEPFPEWRGRVRAAFTTRSDLNLGFHCGDDKARVGRNWVSVLSQSGLLGKPLIIPRMIHGDAMVDADALPLEHAGLASREVSEIPYAGWPAPGGSEPGPLCLLEPEGADAVCSGSSRPVLAVTMADCLTALVFDPVCGTIAAVHAGWRGTRAGILEKSLRFLSDSGRIRADSALVALGPCLRSDSLEVGPEVAAQLPEEFLFRNAGRYFFDMPACNRAQALACGISPEHVRDLGGCTLREPERYFSYRRQGPASGRMAAFISLL